MPRHDQREIRERLVTLRAEHRALDEEIVRLEETQPAEQLNIRRLKKRKLQIKDQIMALEDNLLPDIIA